MRPRHTAAEAAMGLLHRAATYLNTASPASERDLGRIMQAALSDAVGNHFGGEALNWFHGRSGPLGRDSRRAVSWGAWFGTGLDRNGVTEATAMYELGPGLMDSLPSPLFRVARVAMESLPGLRPAFSTIRCGRSSGSQQLTFEVEHALPLSDLQPLMQNL